MITNVQSNAKIFPHEKTLIMIHENILQPDTIVPKKSYVLRLNILAITKKN